MFRLGNFKRLIKEDEKKLFMNKREREMQEKRKKTFPEMTELHVLSTLIVTEN